MYRLLHFAAVLAVFLANISLGESAGITVSFKNMDKSQELSVFRKCEADSGFITVCGVDGTSKPTVTATASDGSNVTFIEDTSVTGGYEFLYKVLPKADSNLTMTCSVSGSSPDSATKTITVINLTGYYPYLSARTEGHLRSGTDSVPVPDGDTVGIRCFTSTGEHTAELNVTLSCLGQRRFSEAGGDADLDLTVSRKDDKKKCVCESSCGNRKAEMSLDITFPPSFISFKGNAQQDNITVSLGDSVAFQCDVSANPSPTITVASQRSGKSVSRTSTVSSQHKSESRFKNHPITTYLDTGAYICTADNELGRPVNTTFYVLAQFGPHLQPSFPNKPKKIHGIYTDKPLELRIPILGYPTPTSYNLTIHPSNSAQPLPVDHNASYVGDLSDQGTVVLSLFVPKKKDVSHYVLSVKNGVGKGLDYSFSVDSSDASSGERLSGAKTGIAIGVVLVVALIHCLQDRC